MFFEHISKLPEKYFVIDFENTGGSLWNGHKITAYGICIVEKISDNYEITAQYMNYINPRRHIPKFIEDLIGIRTEDVNNDKYPVIETEFEKIEQLFKEDMVFTAHCAGVDYSMFNYQYYSKYNRNFETLAIDTCALARKALNLKKAGIADAACYLGIEGTHHQPDFDAFVAAKILIKTLELSHTDAAIKKIFADCIKKFPLPKKKKKIKSKNYQIELIKI